MSPKQASSRRRPDLTNTQRSRGAVSNTAVPTQSSSGSYDRNGFPSGLDTGGSAPLPAISTLTNLGGQQLLTADDVAAFLRVPRSLVYALARRGELPVIRIGERYVRFRAEAIEQWTEARQEWPQAPSSSQPRRRIARTSGSPSTANRGASGPSLRRRVNAPEPGIRRIGPDAS
jgi:excisionase family DNA binding protein